MYNTCIKSIYFQTEWNIIVVTVFLSILNQMEYNRGDSFPFDFEPNANGIPFGSKWKGKQSPRLYSIQYETNHAAISLSVTTCKKLAITGISTLRNILQQK